MEAILAVSGAEIGGVPAKSSLIGRLVDFRAEQSKQCNSRYIICRPENMHICMCMS